MRQFTLADVRAQRALAGNHYFEFLRVPAMSTGVYELDAGAEDPQQPHTEDELYYVASGKGTLLVGDENVPVAAGSMVYVPARVVHRFHSITEAMTIIVFFAPAEYTYRDAPAT